MPDSFIQEFDVLPDSDYLECPAQARVLMTEGLAARILQLHGLAQAHGLDEVHVEEDSVEWLDEDGEPMTVYGVSSRTLVVTKTDYWWRMLLQDVSGETATDSCSIERLKERFQS